MEIDNETKLKLYLLIIHRYKSLISEKESQSITEIRQRCSPYSEPVKKLKERLIGSVINYAYETDFLHATESALDYIRELKNIQLGLTFWLNFEDIDMLKAAPSFDKCLLLAALLRSFGSENVRVVETKSKKNYVLFEWSSEKYAILPETGSLLAGEDVGKLFQNDSIAYSFNDLIYENYEE